MLSSCIWGADRTHGVRIPYEGFVNRDLSFTIPEHYFKNGKTCNVRINGRYIYLSKKFIRKNIGLKNVSFIIVNYSYRLPSGGDKNKFTARKYPQPYLTFKNVTEDGTLPDITTDGVNSLDDIVKNAIVNILKTINCGD